MKGSSETNERRCISDEKEGGISAEQGQKYKTDEVKTRRNKWQRFEIRRQG